MALRMTELVWPKMKKSVVYVTDIPHWAGSTLSLKDMLLSLREYFNPIVLVYAKGEVYEYMVSQGIEVYVVPYDYNYLLARDNVVIKFLHHVARSLRHWLLLKKGLRIALPILRSRDISLVHSNTSAVDFGYHLSRKLHAKHVWHVREMLPLFNKARIIGGLEHLKRQMSRSNKLIFISKACRDYWNINCEENKICVVGDAIRSKTDTVYVKEKKKYILFCSQRLTAFKGADVAIRAFGNGLLPSKGYRLKLIGTCDSSYKIELDRIAQELKIEGIIDFLGRMESSEVRGYMQDAAALIQSSKMEGLGRVAIEAMFYGCPVVARNCGGTLDFVEDGKTGYLWNTEEECAALLDKVSMGENEDIILKAQRLVAEKYSIEGYASQMMEVYNTLL